MKTIRRSKLHSRGIGAIDFLIIALIIGLLGFAGWHAMKTKNSVAKKYDGIRQNDAYGDENLPVNGFYDCVDKVRDFQPGSPQTCEFAERKFTRPMEFTPDNIRNFNYLHPSAQRTVTTIAQKNFAICKKSPETLSITRVLNVTAGFAYVSTGCDGGYAAVLVQQGGVWKEVNLGRGGLTCATAEQYKIPKALVSIKGNPDSGRCRAEDVKVKPLPN